MREQEEVCTGGDMWPQKWPQSNSSHFKESGVVRAKTDARYWLQGNRLFRHSRVSGGETLTDDHYSVRIKFNDEIEERRELFNTGTTVKKDAAKAAAAIYRRVENEGWKAALTEFKPKKLRLIAASKGKNVAPTVGEFIAAAGDALDGTSSRTLNDYCRAFRQIVAAVAGVKSDKSRFDYKTGGAERWRVAVDAVKLGKVTPCGVQAWKTQFVRRVAGDPVAERSAKVSANTMIRQARSLFSNRVRRNQASLLSFLAAKLILPSPLPFEGVGFYERQSMRYHSKIDAKSILPAAQDELAGPQPEAFKVVVLALCCGLRRNEIDKLSWSQVDFTKGVIRIETTRHFRAKSEDSLGEVEIDADLVALLRGWHALATGDFVVESDAKRSAMPKKGQFYRTESVLESAMIWLRSKGVDDQKPLHTLRKEHGSIVAQKYGIHAASLALRHADIGVTASCYLDKKERLSLGLGALLKPKNVEVGNFTTPPAPSRRRRAKAG